MNLVSLNRSYVELHSVLEEWPVVTRDQDLSVFDLPVLITVREGGKQSTIEYSGSELLTIGRSEDCTITVQTSRASRQHAQIVGEGGRFTLIDAGSANGTKIRGEKVSKHALRVGDEIVIGGAKIQFGSPVATEPIARSEEPTEPLRQKLNSKVDVPRPPRSSSPHSVSTSERPVYVRKKSPFAAVEALLSVLLLLVLALVAREYLNEPSQRAMPQPNSSGETLVGEVTKPLPNPERETGLPDSDASETLSIVEDRIVENAEYFDAVSELTELIRLYPGTSAANRAGQIKRILEALHRSDRTVRRARAERAISPLIAEERYGDALVIVEFLGRLAEEKEELTSWTDLALSIEQTAESRLREIESELSKLLESGLAGDALQALVAVRDRFSGVPAYERALPEYVLAGLGTVGRVAGSEVTPAALIELDAQATRAFADSRFADLPPILHRALGLDLPNEERVRILEELVEAHYLGALWDEFKEGIAGQDITITLSKDYTGKLIRADQNEVEIERSIADGKYLDRRPWSRVTPVQRYALFSSVRLGRDGTLGLAFLARRGGDPENFSRALLRLHRQGDKGEALAAAVLARHRGESLPADGYLEYAGRLMTGAEREAEVERRKRLREQEREAIAELRRIRKSEKVSDVLDWVNVLRGQGSFSLADRVLREVIAKTDETMGAEARRLLEDPVLASLPLRESGDPARRIDVFIMGDGYQSRDEQQTAFLNAARSCEKILFSVDPYREYQEYFNVMALHLQSKDAGVDRFPGDVEKDTACDAKVEWQTLTCNPEKVFTYIRRFPEDMARDHQGIVIANDYADVATGGGGVSTLSKAALSLVQHEVGHAFGGLLDEYDYVPGSNPDREIPKGRKGDVPTAELRPNLMAGSDRDDVLAQTYWKNWIDAGEEAWWNNSEVSVFEGGNHTPFEIWRPQSGCMMRDGSGFCVVCMEVMVKQIYRRVRPIDRLDPEAGRVVLEAKEEQIFQVLPMQPRTHDLEVVWRMVSLGINEPGTSTGQTAVKEREGDIFRRVAQRTDVQGRTVHGAEILAKNFNPGWYRLKVEVRDRTPWVIDDPDELLVQRAEWLIQVKGDD